METFGLDGHSRGQMPLPPRRPTEHSCLADDAMPQEGREIKRKEEEEEEEEEEKCDIRESGNLAKR